MGNPLSGFMSELFLTNMEEELEKEGIMPRLWIRYVDDVFAIIDREEVEPTLWELNQRHKDIKFTLETEEEGKIPFLDLLVKRSSGKLFFEVYRKATHTQRFIPRDSNHAMQHKMAAFNCMIHRLVNMPMLRTDFLKEREHIKDTAKKNGFEEEIIDNRIKKIQTRKRMDELTTLYQQERNQRQKQDHNRMAITYDRRLTKKIGTTMSDFGIETIPTSRNLQLKNILGSTKDKKDVNEISGIYKICCPQCNKRYIGQTKRLITTRVNEHLKEAEKKKGGYGINRIFNSKVAQHIVEEGHMINNNDIIKTKEVNDIRRLDFYESFMIRQENPALLMNENNGWCDSPLFKFLIDNE